MSHSMAGSDMVRLQPYVTEIATRYGYSYALQEVKKNLSLRDNTHSKER